MTSQFGRWALVIAAGAIAAMASFLVALNDKRAAARIEIEAAHGELELALASLSVRLASMATALQQADEPSPELFAMLYAQLSRSTPRTHERAMALMPQMPDADSVAALVARHAPGYAAMGYPPFAPFPNLASDPLFPVVMVEPAAARPQVFGYNMGTSVERASAAREALERGVMTASAPVTLSQDGDPSRASFLLLYPVRLPDAAAGFTTAVLGAGMTPAALFATHVPLEANHRVHVEIEIGGAALSVTLAGMQSGEPEADRFTIPLITDEALPAIRTPGFDVPFRASVRHAPGVGDAVATLTAAAAAGLIAFLLMRLVEARAASRRALEAALARREAELGEAHRAQARLQRMDAVGRLVAGVAHDFNNILSVILGNLELLREEEKERAGDPLVREAIDATHRGAHLTRQLLAIGQKSNLEPRPLDAARVLRETAAMLARVLPESVQLTIAPAEGLWNVEADENGLRNALLNLAINARDAMGGRGELVIEAANLSVGPDHADERPEEDLAPGRYVAVSVTDTGSGMTPEIVERAFEPFFTTKNATDGSGLGLPSVLGFCRQSRGACRIRSEPGVGTTVRMLLPVSDGAVAAADPAPAPPAPSGAAARILLAEDEDGVARIVQRHLETAGYAVRRVSSGDAAWSLIDAGEAFDVLITDLVMPGDIQGAELARRVEQARPDMRLLLISGYPQEAAIDGDGVAPRRTVLTKPVPRADLLRTLDAMLRR
jgi:signal transduction histidine kinase